MRNSVLIIAFLLFSQKGFTQVVNDVYKMKHNAKIDSIFAAYNAHSGSIGKFVFDAGSFARIIIVQKIIPDKYEVLLTNNNEGEHMAPMGGYYCIDEVTINTYFEQEPHPIWGSIAIPFKLRFAPFDLTGGSTLGVYYGFKGNNLGENTIGRVVVFGGPSFTPLNDSTSKTPQTQFGITFGLGYVITFSNNFQIGLVTGEDLFNGVTTWAYKFQPWLSFSIGFNFLTNQTKEDKQVLKAAEEKSKK